MADPVNERQQMKRCRVEPSAHRWFEKSDQHWYLVTLNATDKAIIRGRCKILRRERGLELLQVLQLLLSKHLQAKHVCLRDMALVAAVHVEVVHEPGQHRPDIITSFTLRNKK